MALLERPLTKNIVIGGESASLEQYLHGGGYSALRKALGLLSGSDQLAPESLTAEVKASGLRGRGGGGFATGLKWSLVPMDEWVPKPKYVVCNADEMEPGTFKDRILMEGDPHLLIEGIILAAYAIQATEGFIFLRHEYELSARRLLSAIDEAKQARLLGDNILGSEFSFNLHLHSSAGRYICGEETALLNALEGKRAIPRAKPPYPATSGLFGKPTVVNNVETLCCVPSIIINGAEWFRSLSLTAEGGTKLYGVSGRVKTPGLWELPMGTPLREIIEKHAGGMQEGYRFRGVIPGGASTEFMTADHLDVPLDFASVQKARSRLGTGTMIVLDDQTCPIGLVHNLERFFAQESCGWCTPCREGLPWVARLLTAFEDGSARHGDIELLERHCRLLAPGNTFCALAPGAVEPLQSALEYFRDDFERHIGEKRCPYKHGRRFAARGIS